MIYGTAFDRITESRHRMGNSVRREFGLSATSYTGDPWIIDPSTGDLLSGKYGRVPRFNSSTGRMNFGTIGGSPKIASQSSDTKFSYIHLYSDMDGSNADVVIALQPTTNPQRGGVSPIYNPQIQSWSYIPPMNKNPDTPAAQTTVYTETVQAPHQESVAIEQPTAPPPVSFDLFPPRHAGFSYVLLEGETPFNAPGGKTDVFTASADAVGQSVPYIVSHGINTVGPAIVASSTSDAVPISPTEKADRWEYQKRQVSGPASDRIYFEVELRDLSHPRDPIIYKYDVPGGGGGFSVSDITLQDVARGITALSTVGQSEVLRAGAQEAGVSQEVIDDATLAYAAAAALVATYGVGTMLFAPTTAAAAVAPATGEAVAATTTTAATTTAATTAATGATTASTATAVGGAVLKTAGGAILGVGSEAVKTGVEKLTGQLPDGTQGEYPLIGPTQPAMTPTPAPSTMNPLLILAGVAAAVFTLAKK